MFKTFTLCILLTILTLAGGPVLQTGQILSYDANGIVVTNGSVKDDGYYQAGVSRSYSRDGDIVIDNITGLHWEDNESIEKPWITQGNYDADDYNNTSGDTATTYCENFTLGGHEDWRLPSIEELETIVNYGEDEPALTKNIFRNYTSSLYWSSTAPVFDQISYAWYIYFGDGDTGGSDKSRNNHVRCIRNGSLLLSKLTHNGSTVIDDITGLQWQDNEAVLTTAQTWSDAIEYCEDLILDGYIDWRLPNIKELFSIVATSAFDPSIDNTVFLNTVSSNYWSSTSNHYYSSNAWHINFKAGYSDYMSKSSSYYTRCVRKGKFTTFKCPDGQHKKQGERVCIHGTPIPNSGIYLPNCDSGRLVQGQDIGFCDDSVTPVDPPGFTLPTCPDDKRLDQGTNKCN